MKKTLSVTGRIAFAVPFFVFGIFHLAKASQMSGMVPAFLPFHSFWIVLTGLGLIAAAVSLLINKLVKYSMICLALFLVFMILMIHIPGLSNPQMAQMEPMGLLKDLALAGASIFIASSYFD